MAVLINLTSVSLNATDMLYAVYVSCYSLIERVLTTFSNEVLIIIITNEHRNDNA
jgi:hypothetical protein